MTDTEFLLDYLLKGEWRQAITGWTAQVLRSAADELAQSDAGGTDPRVERLQRLAEEPSEEGLEQLQADWGGLCQEHLSNMLAVSLLQRAGDLADGEWETEPYERLQDLVALADTADEEALLDALHAEAAQLEELFGNFRFPRPLAKAQAWDLDLLTDLLRDSSELFRLALHEVETDGPDALEFGETASRKLVVAGELHDRLCAEAPAEPEEELDPDPIDIS